MFYVCSRAALANLSKRRSTGLAIISEVPRLSIACDDVARVSCAKCGRQEAYTKAGLVDMFGDMRLTELRRHLVPGRPRWDQTDIDDVCGTAYMRPA